jgi:RNA polymerase sigma-70 factor (ECF subfamily)
MTLVKADTLDEECDRLLTRVGKGDREALGRLFASEAGRLIAIAHRIVRRRELAEEAVQDAFVSAWRAAPTFDPGRGSARAWLTTIVRNRALNMLRSDARLDLMTDEELQSFQERSGDAEAAYASLSQRNALRACLDQLEPQRRQSILLAYVLGYSHGEIAAALNAPVGTVKAWIRRGVIALQGCLS